MWYENPNTTTTFWNMNIFRCQKLENPQKCNLLPTTNHVLGMNMVWYNQSYKLEYHHSRPQAWGPGRATSRWQPFRGVFWSNVSSMFWWAWERHPRPAYPFLKQQWKNTDQILKSALPKKSFCSIYDSISTIILKA